MNILLAQTKGGVGKTTLATHLAIYLHDQGKKVALLDSDVAASSYAWISEVEKGISVRHVTAPEDAADALLELQEEHEFVICDSPGENNTTTRTLMLLTDLAVFPVGPSILDLRSLADAISILKEAQRVNQGRPKARIVCNKTMIRGRTSRELPEAAKELGVQVAKSKVRDLEAFREAAKQATTVTRMRMCMAQVDIENLFEELLSVCNEISRKTSRGVVNG